MKLDVWKLILLIILCVWMYSCFEILFKIYLKYYIGRYINSTKHFIVNSLIVLVILY